MRTLILILLFFSCTSIYGQVKIVRPKLFPQLENKAYLLKCFPVGLFKPQLGDKDSFYVYSRNHTKAEYVFSYGRSVCKYLYIGDSLHPLPNGIKVGQSYSKIASILKITLKKAPKTIEITFGKDVYRLLTLYFSKTGRCTKIDFDVELRYDVD